MKRGGTHGMSPPCSFPDAGATGRTRNAERSLHHPYAFACKCSAIVIRTALIRTGIHFREWSRTHGPLPLYPHLSPRRPLRRGLGPERQAMSDLTAWLAGICSIGLFAYLFYALLKPERF